MTTALVATPAPVQLVRRERAPLDFTEEQWAMIRNSMAQGSTDAEFAVLMEIARAKRLNPLLGQIHFVPRWVYDQDAGRKVKKWATQTGIDGFRSIADDTGLYDGQDEAEFGYDEEKRLAWAKVRVYRKDIGRAFVGVAHFREYVQYTKNGDVVAMWAEKPHIMLAKCAEALAMRKAFPQDLGDLYTRDELPGTEQEHHAERADRISRAMEGTPQLTDGAHEVGPEDIAACKTTDELDALSPRLSQLPKGPKREAMSKAFKAKWIDIERAAKAAKENPEPPPAAEEREPGADDA